MIKNTKKPIKILTWLLVFSLVVPFFSGCNDESSGYLMDLEIWGVFDGASDYLEITSEYSKVNPFIGSIKYKKFTIENYKEDLLDALASGGGPDIFMINNSWMPSFENKVSPAPDYLINEQLFLNNFVDVVADDFIGKEGEIYSAPLSVDSLALYYNKDLLNAASISTPPSTWEDVIEVSKKITKVDDFGEIYRSGVAMGTAYNINRSSDIVDLLLFQHGSDMPSRKDSSFSRVDNNTGSEVLEFYSQFARSSSPSYSWNSAMHYSIDSFYEGDLAMMLNYSWHIETLKSKNAKLNFAIAPIPQLSLDNPANSANYWSFVVNKNKKATQREGAAPIGNEIRVHETWQFLKFLTFKNDGTLSLINAKSGAEKKFGVSIDPAESYMNKSNRPAARRDLIEKQKTDPILGAFAYGNIIAKSWYRKNPDSVENIWAESIESINKGDATAKQAFNLAKGRITESNRE
jgi:multiple sugar transport system substrate-binding protein